MSLEVVPIAPNQISGLFVYSAKFLCGTIQRGDADAPLLPGTYQTAINIHNPSPDRVEFEKRAIVTLRQDPQHKIRGPLSKMAVDWLDADNGLEVDCVDIRRLLEGSGDLNPFIKGFVVIRAKAILDVVAVYTSTV